MLTRHYRILPLVLMSVLAAQAADSGKGNGKGNVLFSLGGPIGYWSFDEGQGTVAHDGSGNGYDGQIVGAAWVTGKVGNALEMGQDRYVFVGHEKELALGDALTIAAWVRAGDAGETSYMRILSKKSDFPTRDGYEMEYNFRTGELDIIGSGDVICRASGVHLDGAWHHLAGTIDKEQGRLYVDGVERLSTGVVGKLKKDKTTPVIIGRLAGKPYAFFYRTLDEIRLYDYALSAVEIAALALVGGPHIGVDASGHAVPSGNG